LLEDEEGDFKLIAIVLAFLVDYIPVVDVVLILLLLMKFKLGRLLMDILYLLLGIFTGGDVGGECSAGGDSSKKSVLLSRVYAVKRTALKAIFKLSGRLADLNE